MRTWTVKFTGDLEVSESNKFFPKCPPRDSKCSTMQHRTVREAERWHAERFHKPRRPQVLNGLSKYTSGCTDQMAIEWVCVKAQGITNSKFMASQSQDLRTKLASQVHQAES